VRTNPIAYWIPGALIAASLLLGIGIALFPQAADAFWPFSITRADGGDSPIVHDSSLDLLEAPLNVDPGAALSGNSIAYSDGSALMAIMGPDGTLPIADATGASGSIRTYEVKQGDSISMIASRFGVSVNTILWANNLTARSPIKPGMTLVILPVSGIQHTVAKGETLASIARKFSADAEDIASYNGIDSGAGLRAGEVLIIPGGEVAVSSVAKTSTKPATAAKKATIKTGGSLASVKANPYKGGSGATIGGYYSNPVPGGRLTQGVHGWNGVDIGAPAGTPVKASASGTVIVSRVGGWNGGYGNYVVISHPNGTQTLYAHLSSDSVSVGESVPKGETIGGVGKTGEATGNHLHWEVRGAGNPFAGCAEMTFCEPK
jgi:LysM repeat protein